MREDVTMHAIHTQSDRLSRRDVLRAGIGAVAVPAASVLGAGVRSGDGPRVLFLLHLAGGNDGLNTVIPYADPLYHALRPRLSAVARNALRIDERTAMHASLSSLVPQYRAGRLAIVQGVGYAEPDYSHVGSCGIWVSGRRDGSSGSTWWDTALAHPAGDPVEAIALGANPLPITTRARSLPVRGGAGRTPVHRWDYQPGLIARTLVAAVRAVANARVPTLMFASVGGFDTHEDQLPQHARVLQELGDGLAAFQSELEGRRLAERTLLAAWSEFGRRPAENADGGTDHGSAGPVFLLGKAIRGGIQGQAPSLEWTDSGNPAATVDFCAVYATLASGWLGLHVPETPGAIAGVG